MNGEREARAALHRRVRDFIDASEKGDITAESFDELGLDIARHQAEHVPAYRRLTSHRRCHPRDATSVREVPAVPTDAFRLTRIAAHTPSEDAAIFRTSGTTSGARGEHPLSTTATYEKAALAWGRWALFFDAPPAGTQPSFASVRTAIALTPRRTLPLGDSSLHFMVQLFAADFAREACFLQLSPDTLADPGELRARSAAARHAGNAVVVMGASFAFVHVLDALGDEPLALPEGSRIMHTGGFKGRSREVAPSELLARMAATFGVPQSAVVGEYGMTELSSQLYEGTWRAARGLPTPSARHGVFVAPPWMRVVAVDDDTLDPLPAGEAGILRFEDLGNVDSALAVQTADRGRCAGSTVELLGRLPGAPARGCALAVEELMGSP
ncbi:MAG TPA: acyl-protein synthetase [Polyangiaceae bacterium]|nr:acyl-protein synthetase [Polyangiaceae bacterium]